MAISEDTSHQPVPVHSTTRTATTASFSPQASTLMVALLAVDGATGTPATVAVTDSLSGTWTLLKRINVSTAGVGGSAEVWCRYLSSAPGSMTVTGDWSTNGQPAGNLTVRCLLGAASSQTGATGGQGGASVAATAVLTPTQIGSWVYGANVNYFTNETMTANAATSLIDSFQDTTNGDTWSVFKGSASTSSLTSTTYGFTHAVSEFNTAAAEILAAAAAPIPPVRVLGQAVGRASLW